MATWNELLAELSATPPDQRDSWFSNKIDGGIAAIGSLRGERNVLLYASGFLQKPSVPGTHIIMMPEDINGVMAAFTGMDWDRGLTIVLHTPGGATMAVQTLVEYIRSKFVDVEVIVPAYAMSAGTMMALASDRVVLGNQSQLGPIDPQLGGGQHSARAITELFARAREEIMSDTTAAHVWSPILASHGPSLLQYAQDQLDFSERMVGDWLTRYMVSGADDPAAEGQRIASYFNDASNHKSHDKRIGIDEARTVGVTVEKLEDRQELQEAVLTLYHLVTILIEQSPVTKIISSGSGRSWIKSWVGNTP